MNNFRNLKIWNRSIDLATDVYDATNRFPRTEQYGLTSQIRRSVVSISSNIAEGAGRKSEKEFSRFLNIAKGSCYELETQLLISKNLGFMAEEKFLKIEEELVKIEKMIYALVNRINQKKCNEVDRSMTIGH
ncbi:MAG: four helix bundle protein [Balneolaceae bacterium]|nr:four helix bundle protein [Balneolaceae bacterium]